jgi:hypothetical protein
VASAVVTGLLLEPSERMPAAAAVPAPGPATLDEPALSARFEALGAENAMLGQRIAELETRLASALGARAAEAEPLAPTRTAVPVESAAATVAAPGPRPLDPDFVASVDQALDEIRAREEQQREEKRKELQAQRIEERLTRYQETLGLSNAQVRDMRSVLIAQDDKREALRASMEGGEGDRRTMFEGMRTIRDETNSALSGFLSAEQLRLYQEQEEGEFRGFERGRRGDGGPGGGFGGQPGGG